MRAGVVHLSFELGGFRLERFATHLDINLLDLGRKEITDIARDLRILDQGSANLFD